MPPLPESAVRRAYEAHGAELFRFARRALGDEGSAEDAVQETFLRAWRAADRFDPTRASQRTWLFAILRNVVIDTTRLRRVRPPMADTGGDETAGAVTDDGIDRAVTRWQVERALADLDVDHRHALVEVHWRGRRYGEVAAELGVPEGTVKSRVYYALRAMRSTMEDQGWRDE